MALDTNAVLVQLVLREQVPSNFLVQVFDITLLVTNLLVLSMIELESLFQLELQEGILVNIGFADAMFA